MRADICLGKGEKAGKDTSTLEGLLFVILYYLTYINFHWRRIRLFDRNFGTFPSYPFYAFLNVKIYKCTLIQGIRQKKKYLIQSRNLNKAASSANSSSLFSHRHTNLSRYFFLGNSEFKMEISSRAALPL